MGKVFRILAALSLMSLFVPSAWAVADEVSEGAEPDSAVTAPETSEKPDGSGEAQSPELGKRPEQNEDKGPSGNQPAAAPAASAPSPDSAAQGPASAADAAGETAVKDLSDSALYGTYATATPIDGSDVDVPTVVEDLSGAGQSMDVAPVRQLDEVNLGGTIGDDDVPLGAFDAPVSPVPWVSGLGILATLAYALMVVSRRFAHIDQLRELEQELLAYEEATESAQSTVKCAG